MRTETVTVLLIEDDAMVRGWVRLALEGSEFFIVGEAANAQAALELVERRRPQILLTDYRLPDGTGTELVKQMRSAGVTTPAAVMTANERRGLNEEAREAGAQGTVLKTGGQQALLAVLRGVGAGGESFDPGHPPRKRGAAALGPREREIVRLMAEGRTNREIAASLSIGTETVKDLVERTFAKLGVRRRAEAVSAAYDRGLL